MGNCAGVGVGEMLRLVVLISDVDSVVACAFDVSMTVFLPDSELELFPVCAVAEPDPRTSAELVVTESETDPGVALSFVLEVPFVPVDSWAIRVAAGFRSGESDGDGDC